MNKEKRIAIGTGVVFLVYGVWMLMRGLAITVAGKSGDYGPGFMPRLIGAIIILLSALLVFTTWWGVKKGMPAKDPVEVILPDYKSILATIVLLGAYMIALKPVGFILSSVVDLFNNLKNGIKLIWVGEKRRKTPRKLFLNGCTG